VIEYRRPTQEDVDYLIANMRQADIDEIKASTSVPVDYVVERSVGRSTLVLAFVFDGELMAIFGYGGGTLSDEACIWMLGTDGLSRCKKSFIKESRKVVSSWVECFPDRVFTNAVHIKNAGSIKLLIALGARFPHRTQTPHGETFITFTIGGQ